MSDSKSNALTQLAKLTEVVADTGELELLKKYDATDVGLQPLPLYLIVCFTKQRARILRACVLRAYVY